MKNEWLEQCLELSRHKADLWSGCRKIIRNVHFSIEDFGDDLTMADCGFTKSKTSMLTRNYLHEESRSMAVTLWDRRCQQEKYGSVGFSCYNHLIKGDIEKKSKRASVMGPCIQSVVLTWVNKKQFDIDVFYRTTELLKKFPADLVFLRDVLLTPFDMTNLGQVNFHFANVTLHPMYVVTLLPLVKDPIQWLERIKRTDKRFYEWTIKWTAQYLCKEYLRGIEKFSQAMRVRKDALERLDPKTLKTLQKYLRDNHPGYRNEYVAPEEDEEE